MRRVILSLLLVTAMALPAYAQYPGEQCSGSQCSVSGSQAPYTPPAAARPRVARDASVVQIISRRGDHSIKGTGVIVDASNGTATIVSCAHILKEDYQPSIRYFNGQEQLAKIVTTDALADLSVLQAKIVKDARIIRIDDDPQPGTMVYYYGYSEKGFTGGSGTVHGYEASNIIFSGEVLSGVSGGPIYTKRGLVGIVIESRQFPGEPWRTYGPSATRIRRLLKKVLPPYPNRPGIIVPKPPVRKKPIPRTSRPIPTVRLKPQEPLVPVVFPPRRGEKSNATQIPISAETTRQPRDVGQTDHACLPAETPNGQTAQIDATTRITIDARLDRIEKLIAALAKQPSQPGPAGPQGPPGDDGKAGPIGPAGKDAPLQPIPIDDIVAEVIARLPPIHVKVIRDGKVIEEADVYLGGTLPLRLVPVR